MPPVCVWTIRYQSPYSLGRDICVYPIFSPLILMGIKCFLLLLFLNFFYFTAMAAQVLGYDLEA